MPPLCCHPLPCKVSHPCITLCVRCLCLQMPVTRGYSISIGLVDPPHVAAEWVIENFKGKIYARFEPSKPWSALVVNIIRWKLAQTLVSSKHDHTLHNTLSLVNNARSRITTSVPSTGRLLSIRLCVPSLDSRYNIWWTFGSFSLCFSDKPPGMQPSVIRCLSQARTNWEGWDRKGIWL